MRWYLTVMLIYIPLMISDIEYIFSYICWPFLCLWRNVYAERCPNYNQAFDFLLL